jgi:hypothetical protein
MIFSCKRELSQEIPYPGGITDTTGAPPDTSDTTVTPPPDTSVNIDTFANFQLVTDNGLCSNAKVEGRYVSGQYLTEDNKVTLDVMVITPGMWSVTSGTVNGMVFSDVGIFTDTGRQTITIYGAGIPGEFGNTVIPVSAGSSDCSFGVTVTEH